MKNREFGFIESIGAIILVILDPNRGNNKEYLKPKYLKLNRIVGFIVIFLSIAFLFYMLFNYIFLIVI